MAKGDAKALEERLQALVGGELFVEGAALGDGVKENKEGVALWNTWYAEAFGALEARVEAVGAAADATVAGMREEVEGMKGEVLVRLGLGRLFGFCRGLMVLIDMSTPKLLLYYTIRIRRPTPAFGRLYLHTK